jgi:hypothetical protein
VASVRPVVVVGLVGLVGVAGFVGGISAAQLGSRGSPGSRDSMPVRGSLTLVDAQTAQNRCVGIDGFEDIRPTTYVVILRDGGVVGATRLGPAVADQADGTCMWRWTVPAVPRGRGVYSVVISDRGWNAFTSSQLARGDATLTLRRLV